MRSLARVQRGLGLWSGLYVFGSIAFIALCLIKIGPLYLNEASLQKAVRDVAAKETSSAGDADVAAIRSALQKRWDVDYISQIEPKDIEVVRTDKGLYLSYDYDARAELFANIAVVVHFKADIPIKASVG